MTRARGEIAETAGDGARLDEDGYLARMREQIREGEDSMPAFPASALSDEQLESLMAYLVSTNGVAN